MLYYPGLDLVVDLKIKRKRKKETEKERQKKRQKAILLQKYKTLRAER